MKGLGAVGLVATVGNSASADTSANTAAMPDKHGPLRKNRFVVEIDSISIAGFSRVELPDAAVTDVEYREGNESPTSRKLKGSNEYDPLVLEKGVTTDSIELFKWFKKVQDGAVDESRKSIAVTLLNTQGEMEARWEFKNAWPGRYNGPDLDASANGVAIETLEILHEGMKRTQ